MCEIKLYDYQKEIVESKDDEIICNWSRGLGKTYTVISKIIKEKPNSVIWVGSFCNVQDKVKEVLEINNLMSEVECINLLKDKIKIKFLNNPITINIQKYYRGCRPVADLFVFNNMLPYRIKNIECKQIISMISINNYDGKLQKLFSTLNIKEQGKDTLLKYQLINEPMLKRLKEESKYYYDEIDILSVPENITIYTPKNNRLEELMMYYNVQGNNIFLIQTLAKLQKEYDEIVPSKDNVMTRNNLLKMIMDLQKMLLCRRQ